MQNISYGSISNGHSAHPGQHSSSYPPSATSVNGEEEDSNAQSQNGSVDGAMAAGPSTGANGYGQYLHPHDADIMAHVYNSGFLLGNYADVIIETPYNTYRLHSLIIARSPYLTHLISISPPRSGIIPIFRVPLENIPEITGPGFTIALGYLYSSMSLHNMTRENARSVLAAGCLLGGMEVLCQYAYEMCRDSISLDTLDEWIAFVNTLSPPDGASSPHEVPMPHQYAHPLRNDVFNFLVFVLPEQLDIQNPGSNGREMLLQIFARLPFEFFKEAIESPKFSIGMVQQRFQFAKAAIDLRKRTRGGGVEETVVLAFGGAADPDTGSYVHVTRKTKKRALFKLGMAPSGSAYDLYFTGSRGNPRQCIIMGEDVEPIFFRFETPEVFMTNTTTTIYRNQEIVAVFDWTANNYLGLATVRHRQPFPMSQLVLQGNAPGSRAFFLNQMKFEWRREKDDPFGYNLYAPQNIRIASFRRQEQDTPVGPSHGFMQYTFVQPALLLESLLALCVVRWVDNNQL